MSSSIPTLDAQPVTFENFAPYGDLIQGSSDPSTVPSKLVVNRVPNPIPAFKYNRMSPIVSTYPQDDSNPAPVTAIFVFRATPPPGLAAGSTYEVRMFERHAATTQAFIPMARGEWGGGIGEPKLEGTGGGMIVLAALNGPDDKPDFSTLKAFLTSPSQGVSYHAGIWHHSMLSLTPTDYAGVDTQITQNSSLKIDCEALRRTSEEEPFLYVRVPKFLS